MNKERINTTIDLVLLMLYTVSSIFLCVQISFIETIDDTVKYFLIGILILLLLSYIFYIFSSSKMLFFKRTLLIILTFFYTYLSFDVYKTNNELEINKINTYYRLNLVSFENEIIELNNTTIGTLINDRNYFISFEDKNESFNLYKSTFKEYHMIDKLINDLRDNKIKGAILSDQNIAYITQRYPDLKDKLNVLSENYHSVEVSHISRNIDHNNAYSILLSVTDEDDVKYASATIQCYLVIVDPIINKISFTKIPSNLYIPNIAYDSYPDSLQNVSYNGIDNLLYSIENMIDIKIDYFVKINSKYIINNIDIIGTLKISKEESIDGNVNIIDYTINNQNINEYLISNQNDISDLLIATFNAKDLISGAKLNNFLDNFKKNSFTNLPVEVLNELFIKMRFLDWSIEEIILGNLNEYHEPCISYGVSDKFEVSIMDIKYIKNLYQQFINMKHIELMNNFEFDLNYIRSISMPTKLNEKIITQENMYWKIDNYFSVLPDSMIHPVEVEKWQNSVSFDDPNFNPDNVIQPIE